MKKKIKTQHIVSLILLVLFVLAGYSFVYNPGRLKIKKIHEEIDALKKINMLRNDIGTLMVQLEEVYNHFPVEKDVSWLVGKMSILINQTKLKLLSMEPQQFYSTKNYLLIPIKIRLMGDYHQIGELVSKIESSQRYLRLERLELTSTMFTGKLGAEERIKKDRVILDVTMMVETCFPEKEKTITFKK
jgi:Tfp pilus assembly protein PilO